MTEPSSTLLPLSVRAVATLTLGLSLSLTTACSTGGGGGSTTAPPAGPPANVQGTWTITETTTSATSVCAGEVGTVENYNVSVTQSGSSITVSTPVGVFTGSVSGNTVTWTGSYPEDGGIVTTTFTLTITNSDQRLDGMSSWQFSDGVDFCTGTTSFGGDKISSSPAVAVPGLAVVSPEGVWTFAQHGVDRAVGEAGGFLRALRIETDVDGLVLSRLDGTDEADEVRLAVTDDAESTRVRGSWSTERVDGSLWIEQLELIFEGERARGRSTWSLNAPDGSPIDAGVDRLVSLPAAGGPQRFEWPSDRYAPQGR